ARDAALAPAAEEAGAAIRAVDAGRMLDSARALRAMGPRAAQETRLHLARAISDLATAAHVIAGQRRFLRRLGVRAA
ncbi:hypothetical protein ACFQ5C_22975, partial [Methylobacterium goesingense]